jgi:hypothetical protein
MESTYLNVSYTKTVVNFLLNIDQNIYIGNTRKNYIAQKHGEYLEMQEKPSMCFHSNVYVFAFLSVCPISLIFCSPHSPGALPR